ncbi:MAG: sensor histidine kinase [Acidimicrobiales bacterium]|nr:sensor histidine kinase [Acidimicrobiales bacterium]
MASLAELCRLHTTLSRDEVGHLQRLVASWGLVADLCFSDLLLFAPMASRPGGLVVLGQIRPTTSQTLYRADRVGQVLPAAARPLVAEAWRDARIVDGVLRPATEEEPVEETAIPVCRRGKVLGVVTRDVGRHEVRQPGELERAYLGVFARLADMIAAGEFPFADDVGPSEQAPRVGDGVFLLDAAGRVAYASPNAMSALHRMGVHANAAGQLLGELGVDDGAVRRAFVLAAPVTEELEAGPEVTMLARCIPLLRNGQVTGGVVLVRDISEVRRRDRMLVSKDATIREIHHRVKNNLQTISSLLRLQVRRLASAEARAAVEESVRRIRAIALVHETLAHEAGDDVAFLEIVRPLARMVEEGLASPERPVRIRVEGDGGKLPAAVATPLAVVITELLQNTVEHAYPDDGDGSGAPAGRVVVELANDGARVTVRVVDDGAGLPPGFTLDRGAGLGLTIVRTLVDSELGGEIELRPGRPTGTVAEVRVPLGVVLPGAVP